MANVSSNRTPLAVIGAVSALAIGFLFWLIYFREGPAGAAETVAFLPYVNATFNALSASALLLGVVAIKRKDRATHQRLTTAALIFSALFLVSYITYHSLHGDTPFPGQGPIRPIYFFILISHIGLSIVALPLVLTSFYFGWTDQVARHRRLAKVTFPLWLYVSVTGVAIVALLKAYT